MLLKLRQAALHPLLVKSDDAEGDAHPASKGASGTAQGQKSVNELKAAFGGTGDAAFKDEALRAFKRGEFEECFNCLVRPV